MPQDAQVRQAWRKAAPGATYPANVSKRPIRGELAFIQSLRARTSAERNSAERNSAVRLGIGDDCAVLRPPRGHDMLVTTDFSLEGRHFRRDTHTAQAVGHRCLARGLSDLAAMGAKPLAAFLSLALPAGFARTNSKWVDGFFSGLLALAQLHGTPLAGGDTSTAPGAHILADIVLIGSAPRGSELRRSTARAGDLLYVTGTLGAAALELQALLAHPGDFAKADANQLHPHLFPQPRLAVGNALRRRRIATACIDVSDGLSTDLQHLCDESGVGASITQAALPHADLHSALSRHAALHGGEDYELLFTARPATRVPRSIAGVTLTCIGVMTKGSGMLLDGKPLKSAGWEHTL